MIRRVATTAIAAILWVAQAGCDNPTAQDTPLRSARAKWASQAPAAYSYIVSRGCFCPVEAIGPVTVLVRNGVVESLKYTQTGADVPLQYRNWFPTVEGLFAQIDSARANRVARLDVTYDPTLGYPTRIDVDVNLNIADEEYTYVASNLLAR